MSDEWEIVVEGPARNIRVLSDIFGEHDQLHNYLPRIFVVENRKTGERKLVEAPSEEHAKEDITASKWIDPYIVKTNEKGEIVGSVERPKAHAEGIPHLAVHLEIVNDNNHFLIWMRKNGRLEIPGGHVDWLEHLDRAESYQEAALREACEELNLWDNWQLRFEDAVLRLEPFLEATCRVINQLPSSAGNNNEWVMVHRLHWQSDWGDPADFVLGTEGNTGARWLTLDGIVAAANKSPKGINSALTLLLQRHDRLFPLRGGA